ncbi:type II secretion system protein GspG [Kineobactrum salinum]|uniref:Type II secretion system protein GspG C-terminal domain-containing protein n=1 Tax=Kineobactrum salinum TaxID=2708301 RepID=A0A6C0TWU2_9GAMM|nr:type II secretion system protein GspG [Kineobactrum salinum]QIB64251.1 hypothetical protein G3T16_01345 [Kineobactrum salinum]
MRTAFATIALAVLLGACANPVRDAEQAVAANLRYVESLDFRNLEEYPGSVVCGQYRAIQRFGETSHWRIFVYRAGEVQVAPNAADRAIFCSEDPALHLYQQFSIQVDGNSSEALAQVAADLRLMSGLLEQYYQDHAAYPTNERGLQALAAPASEQPNPRKAPANGYLPAVPTDPWGRPYQYEAAPFAGSKQPPSLLTQGADGKPGGKGLDADITLEHLSYIEHALTL